MKKTYEFNEKDDVCGFGIVMRVEAPNKRAITDIIDQYVLYNGIDVSLPGVPGNPSLTLYLYPDEMEPFWQEDDLLEEAKDEAEKK